MDDLIVKFCEDRRSWLVVIAGTLGLCLVFTLPCVDDYLAVCEDRGSVEERLLLATESAKLLTGFERRRAEQEQKLDEKRDATLNESNEADYRNAIVKMVRDSGCQLRRLNIAAPQIRAWQNGDNPLEKSLDKTLKPTGFSLERRQVSLSLVGSSASVRRLIGNFEQDDKQVHVEAIELKPLGSDGHRVELTMQMWYFTLARKAA